MQSCKADLIGSIIQMYICFSHPSLQPTSSLLRIEVLFRLSLLPNRKKDKKEVCQNCLNLNMKCFILMTLFVSAF